jgi:hypothetical protein
MISSAYGQDQQGSDVKLWIRCGADVIVSDEIRLFHFLDSTHDVAAIKDKLLTGNQNEKVLSAIWLMYKVKKDSILLAPAERKAIAKIVRSKCRYELCVACTFTEKGRIKELFGKKREASVEIVMDAISSEL